jgi:hypothetical protein
MPTSDDFPGPNIAEELQLEDRTADGNPTIDGAVRLVSGDLVAKLPSGVKSLTTGTGMSEGQHDGLDDLVHWLAETNYTEITRSAGKVTNVTAWTDSGKTVKVRELVVTRAAGKVSQLDMIQYDGAGSEKQRMTGVITRSAGKIASVQWTETGS